jgi:hypothetical protein
MPLDQIRQIFWDAFKEHWPEHAEVEQPELGNLRVTYKMNNDPSRPNKDAQWISIRFSDDVIAAMNAADDRERQRIAAQASRLVGWRMRAYDPEVQRGEAFIVEVDDRALDK